MNRTYLLAPALLVSFTLAAPAAHATLMMRIDDLSTAGIDVELTDTNGDGFLSYSGSVGNWFSLTAGVTSPFLGVGGPYYDEMGILSFDATGTAGGTLRISLSDTDFTRTDAMFTAAAGGTTVGTTNFSTYLSESNTAFDTSTLLSSLGDFSGPAFSGTDTAAIDVGNPYALTMIASIDHTGWGTTKFGYTIQVPEPAPLALFGIGLVALATVRRQARR